MAPITVNNKQIEIKDKSTWKKKVLRNWTDIGIYKAHQILLWISNLCDAIDLTHTHW